ncbi:MAG: alanine--tRNA ligase [Candidatus Eisenbacteria sp.]|nr:alanine--tRNA ligase [Candidatus Eisenbacteria bacterium]
MTSQEIRRKFIEFFTDRRHVHVPSASLVPEEETGLLFTTAGMLQFRNHYQNPDRAPYPRAVTVQKCLRAGGKDSDIENVGRTARHCTFFEMLGNFSFGDYFKQEAIEWGWEFVTQVLGLQTNALWVSVYEEDDEAHEIWQRSIGIPAGRIVRLSRKDNFWGPAGVSGVCGPCSEIYYDAGEGVGCGRAECAPGCDCDRFVEFWNLVFPQFFQEPDGTLRPLGRPGVDTGMGLERLAAILQGVPNIFETDLFAGIVRTVRDLVDNPSPSHRRVAMIADHSRALAFAIADGILPSNEGRGYVLRRILRRAVRTGQWLEIDDAFLKSVVGAVIDVMHEAYPELAEQREHIAAVVDGEESRFLRTLEHGAGVFEEIVSQLADSGRKVISGGDAFRLYDTYGFPLDLTEEMAAERGLTVDRVGFQEQMDEQKVKAKGTSRLGRARQTVELDWGPASRFVGYQADSCEAEITLVAMDGAILDSAGPGDEVDVVLSRTPFYGESGGQVGDRGWIEADGMQAEVTDARKPDAEHTVHRCRVQSGTLMAGMKIQARIDVAHRRATERHHTSTHLLQAALREVLGKHVKQSGSLVGPEGFRFDFSHPSAVDSVSLTQVERRVNEMIVDNTAVEIRVKDVAEARQMGALAFFGDKYGAEARVVRIGEASLELCGGTHVRAVGEIGAFRIVRESSIGAGVRRIEAVSGSLAYELGRRQLDVLAETAELLRGSWEEVPEKARQLLDSRAVLEKNLEEIQIHGTGGRLESLLRGIETHGGHALLVARADGMDGAELGKVLDRAKESVGSGAFVLASALDRKVVIVVGVSDDLAGAGKVHAGAIAKALARELGGNGGGKPTFAQGGGQTPEALDEALAKTRARLLDTLSGG